jgi:ribonuclease P protein component
VPQVVAIANSCQCFPRQNRLTRTDEYSSVFDFRRAIRGSMFMLHYLPRPEVYAVARLGLVIGKKQVKSSVRRNLIKRLAREIFRKQRAGLEGYDIVLRLHARPATMDRPHLAGEIATLLGKLRPRQKLSAKTQAN